MVIIVIVLVGIGALTTQLSSFNALSSTAQVTSYDCVDSDHGFNPLVPGVTYSERKTYIDTCASDSQLIEYGCDTNGISLVKVNCKCSEARCR